jgi:hypothetical protein
MMVIDNKFSIGQIVYLVTDSEQLKRIVSRIIVTPTGLVYELNSGVVQSSHYDFEISDEINVLVKTNG